jgi:hypothetical protein
MVETILYRVEVPTFKADIYAGLREGYDGPTHSLAEVWKICRDYCDYEGLCVTVDPTHFYYTNGNEPGVKVGLINYPRFPSTFEEVENKALEIALLLKRALNQNRVSIVMTDKTIMLEER